MSKIARARSGALSLLMLAALGCNILAQEPRNAGHVRVEASIEDLLAKWCESYRTGEPDAAALRDYQVAFVGRVGQDALPAIRRIGGDPVDPKVRSDFLAQWGSARSTTHDALALPWLLRLDRAGPVDHRLGFLLVQAWGCESVVWDSVRANDACRRLVAGVGEDLALVRATVGSAARDRAAAKQRLQVLRTWLPPLGLGTKNADDVAWVLTRLGEWRFRLERGEPIERGELIASRLTELERQLRAAAQCDADREIEPLARRCRQICPTARYSAVPVATAQRAEQILRFAADYRAWRRSESEIASCRRRMKGDVERLEGLERELSEAKLERDKWERIARKTKKQIHRTNYEEAQRKWRRRRSSVRTVRQRLERPEKNLGRLLARRATRPVYPGS